MSRNFELLKKLETQALPTLDGNSNIRVMPSSAAILADELAQIERIVGHSISKLKAVVEEGAVVVKTEQEAAEQTIAALKAEGATLAGKLRDAEQSLQSRRDEVNDLSAKLQLLTNQVAQLGQSLQQAKSDAASEVQRATANVENAKLKIAALETQVGESESIIRVKDTALAEVEQVSRSKIAQLESWLRGKEALIAESASQIGALKAEVSRLKDGMLEMASFVTMRTKIMTDGNTSKRATTGEESMHAAKSQPIYSQVSILADSALLDR